MTSLAGSLKHCQLTNWSYLGRKPGGREWRREGLEQPDNILQGTCLESGRFEMLPDKKYQHMVVQSARVQYIDKWDMGLRFTHQQVWAVFTPDSCVEVTLHITQACTAGLEVCWQAIHVVGDNTDMCPAVISLHCKVSSPNRKIPHTGDKESLDRCG